MYKAIMYLYFILQFQRVAADRGMRLPRLGREDIIVMQPEEVGLPVPRLRWPIAGKTGRMRYPLEA